MKKMILLLLILCIVGSSALAGTVCVLAVRRSPAGTQVPKTVGGQTWEPSTADSSGNGYHLSVWDQGGAGLCYRNIVGTPTVTMTGRGQQLQRQELRAASRPCLPKPALESKRLRRRHSRSKPHSGWKTAAIGRLSAVIRGFCDNRKSGPVGPVFSRRYRTNALAIKFCDVSGYWHEAVSAINAFQSFNFPTNNDGVGVPFYSMAAVSDGSTLSLYLKNLTAGTDYALIAQTNMTTSGSPNRALTAGTGDGGDWDAGQLVGGPRIV